MNDIIAKHFGLSENDVEAQALNEEVTANAATSVNNVPACEDWNPVPIMGSKSRSP